MKREHHRADPAAADGLYRAPQGEVRTDATSSPSITALPGAIGLFDGSGRVTMSAW